MKLISKAFLLLAVCSTSSMAFANETGFRSKITQSEDCSRGWTSCTRDKDGLGAGCQIVVNVADHSGNIGSNQDSRGANKMFISGAPKIESGSATLGGQTYRFSSGRASDNFTIGGSFTAVMGETSRSDGSSARVYFRREKGVAKAYAAYIYVGKQAYLCGVVRKR